MAKHSCIPTFAEKRGFTLVEVVVGAFIFVMLLAAGSSAVVQTQKLAHTNVMHNTARTVMEGYMEQMKGLPFGDYKDTLADPVKVPFQTKGIDSLKTAKVIQFDDPLYAKRENKKVVLLDIDESGGTPRPLTMDLYITPEVRDISATEGLQVFEVTLTYKYDSIYSGSVKSYEGSIRFIKTAVSEY